MPKIQVNTLQRIARDCFHAAGFPKDEAELIAELLVLSNLCGHESHGVRQLPRYLQRIRDKEIIPGAPVTIVQETPATAMLDGHRTLGHVAATRAMELCIKKAQATKISAVSVRNLDHTGRVGAYPEMAAARGLVGMCFCSGHGAYLNVVPFGGIEGKLGTNPFAAAFPYDGAEGPILLDFATSIVAGNKVLMAKDSGVETGEGWIIDHEGNPIRDPQAVIDKKAFILPLGGEKGYKGYALAIMNEIMSGILTGVGTVATTVYPTPTDNVTFMIVIDPMAFVTRDFYNREINALVDYMHKTRVRPGDPPVQMPGEYEWTRRAKRRVEGIDLDAGVWNAILKSAREMKVAVPEA